ncbi:TonB-dependent receptor [Danxiaibacter flavus]|uniref:TonB-dependent receptor n=1 Tax=Danxiaibacter flavus TaxID=3049108 RepID=A0ABV3ZAV5_9BACT|nr:TonB-dependent receptor [Chitinophagaceae bacterium DXS]
MKQQSFLKKVLLTAFSACICCIAMAQSISGKVIDQNNTPLAGASVEVKNTTRGTATDEHGEFTINASHGNILVFSLIGYKTRHIAVTQDNIVVKLEHATIDSSLSDVVVVGYATQKKVNMTGSVAQITSKQIENRPTTNISSSLAGLAPGVSVYQGSGKPGSDGATIRIRGTGTLPRSDQTIPSSPLIIVDGIISTMDAVNPNDVASISILRDAASAAIYGSQGANGVVLITTKKGNKNKTTVTYNGLFSIAQPSNIIRPVTDYIRNMKLINEGYINLGQSPVFPESVMQTWTDAAKDPYGKTESGYPNYVVYPNTDWVSTIFEKNVVQNHNISVSGGNDKVTYLLSGGYLNNQGIMRHTGAERYQLRANVESKITDFLSIGTQTYGLMQSLGKANTDNAFNFLRATTPGLYPYYDGFYGLPSATQESLNANNILTYLDGTGGSDLTTRFNTTWYGILKLANGLTLEPRFNYQNKTQEIKSYPNVLYRRNFASTVPPDMSINTSTMTTQNNFNKEYSTTLEAVLRYTTQIGDHAIGALAGYNQYYYDYYFTNTSKKGLIDPTITTPASASVPETIDGNENDRSTVSWFGRVTYNYKQRYLFEVNLRRDASSRFGSNYRWGTFPSLSAGWRISEENFFERFKESISNLKLRASWGKLGSSNLGDYDWQALYSKVNYSFNNLVWPALAQTKIPNPNLRWEASTLTDIALEAAFLKSRLNVEIGYYNKLTTNILTVPTISMTMGTKTAPTANTASLLNRGVEAMINWRDKAGQVSYSIGGNFSYNYNTIKSYLGPLVEGWTTDATGKQVYTSNIGSVYNNGAVEGHMINELLVQQLYRGSGSHKNSDGSVNANGGPGDGMIRTPDDLQWVKDMMAAGYKFQPSNTIGKGQLYYGDFIYADNNKDSTYGNSYDRKWLGKSATPKFNFGLNLSASWKGFDLSMLWAGSAGMSYRWNTQGFNSSIVQNGYSVSDFAANNHYYYNDANPNDPANNISGKYPRLKNTSDPINTIANDFYVYDASYIKLKNLQFGYTLPAALIRKAYMSNVRAYISAENLLIITSYPGMDPEIGADVNYPTMKQFAFGLNVTF